MKKKNTLLILLFILITTFVLMPKAKAVQERDIEYYNQYQALNDPAFFNASYKPRKKFAIKQTSVMRTIRMLMEKGYVLCM